MYLNIDFLVIIIFLFVLFSLNKNKNLGLLNRTKEEEFSEIKRIKKIQQNVIVINY